MFLGHGSRTINAPFGDSHDGRNAAVWASGSQSLRDQGPIASRLGTRSPETGVYANHPPLIYLETALAELVGFGTRAATRAPAWLGALALLVLMGGLLRESGLGSTAAGIAVLLMATTPMFLVYGTMLDTPMTSLPFGVGLLLLWERARRGDNVRPVLAGGLAVLAVLAGWQSLLLSAAIGGWAAIRVMRGAERRRVDLAFVGGGLVGGLLLLLWLLWALGGTLRPLLDQFQFRTGQPASVGIMALLEVQRGDVLAMFGVVALLGVGGLVLAFRDPRLRGVAALATAVTFPYPFLFRSGAANHEYWNYWFLLPLAVGLAVGVETLLRYWASRGRQELVLVLSAAGLGALLALTAWSAPGGGEWLKISGYRAAIATTEAKLAPQQREAWFAGAIGEPAAWLSLATGRPAVAVPQSRYEALAGSRPADMVLVGEVRCVAGDDDRTYGFRTAESLLDWPPVVQPC